MITRRYALVFTFLSAGLLLPLAAHGGGNEKSAKPALRYERTYESAMFEARVRGVPIFFSRHKDF